MNVVQQRWTHSPGGFAYNAARSANARPARRRPFRLLIEPLEGRVQLATHVVFSEADAGPGTLRQAILDSNASVGTSDTILFAIGAGVRTIRPNSAGAGPLPAVTDAVVIDATAPPTIPTQQVEVSGEAAPAGSDGMRITAGVSAFPGTSVRGLTINRFPGSGVVLAGAGRVSILGCRIGTDVTGSVDLGNTGHGVRVENGDNQIGTHTPADRNVISGNGGDGIHVIHVTGSAMISGNYVGTAADGVGGLGNAGNGIAFHGSEGIFWPSENTVCANGGDGIAIDGDERGGSRFAVDGNRIGVNAAGAALGNAGDGVHLHLAGGGPFAFSGGGIGSPIGSPSPVSNVISANAGDGIRIVYSQTGPSGTRFVQVVGNAIGAPFGNGGHGVSVTRDDGRTGGTYAAYLAENIIALNGTRPEGAAGVFLEGDVHVNVGSGTFISNRAGTVHSGLGIDLAPAGVTPNDPLDADTGANGLQNHPELSYARVANGTLSVGGTLQAAPSTPYTINLYSARAAGPDEGSYLGSDVTTTDAAGNATFDVTFPFALAPGDVVRATATLPSEAGSFFGSTSEFSAGVTVTPGPAVVASRFVFEAAPHLITIRFNSDVGRSLAADDLTVRRVASGAAIHTTGVSYDPVTNTATFRFEGMPGAAFPDGNYRATLRGDGVADAAGVTLPGDYSLDFFVLAGDVNRNRVVDGTDFAVLARNFGRTGLAYFDGDLTGEGAVNGSDFAILAANFGQTLPPPAPAPAAVSQAAPAPKAAPTAARVTWPAPPTGPASPPRPQHRKPLKPRAAATTSPLRRHLRSPHSSSPV